MDYLLIWFYGITLGSFLNVCIYRMPHKESVIYPRSACGHCGQTLKALDLIPIFSWLFLKGKCRYCSGKIAMRYPAVEALTGFVLVTIYLRYGLTLEMLVLSLLSLLLIVMALIDYDHKKILNQWVLAGAVLSLCAPLVAYFSSYSWYGYHPAGEWLLGSSVPMLVILLLNLLLGALMKRQALGMGDVKVFIPIGGFLGLVAAFQVIWLAFILGGIFSLIWLFLLKGSSKDTLPFGPFIALGVWILLLWR